MHQAIEIPELNRQDDIYQGINLFMEKLLYEPDDVGSMIQLIQTWHIKILNSADWDHAFLQHCAPMKRLFSAYTTFLWAFLGLSSLSAVLILVYMTFIDNVYYLFPAALLFIMIILDLYCIVNKNDMENWLATTYEATPEHFVLKMTKLIEYNIPVKIDISQCTFLKKEHALTLHQAVVANQTAIQPFIIMRFKDIEDSTNSLIKDNKKYQQTFIIWRAMSCLLQKDIASHVVQGILYRIYPRLEFQGRLKAIEFRKIKVFFNENCANTISSEEIQTNALSKALLNRRSTKQSSDQILDSWVQEQNSHWSTGQTFFKGNTALVIDNLKQELEKPLCRYIDF